METLVLVLHVVVALSMVVIILLQQGKGADAGASFGGGGGASGTMFGSLGAMPFLTKLTAMLAVTFFITSLTLAVLASKSSKEVFAIDAPGVVSGAEDVPSVRVNDLAADSDLPPLESGEMEAGVSDLPIDALGDDLSGETSAEGQPLDEVVE